MVEERVKSFSYAIKGIVTLFKEEPNALIHLFFTFVVLVAGWWFQITSTEWALVIICIATVLAAEAMNSAIEALTDLVSPEIHPLAGKTKDLAAGAVLLTSLGAIAIGLIIFLPKVLAMF